jgi:hypothetical protein
MTLLFNNVGFGSGIDAERGCTSIDHRDTPQIALRQVVVVNASRLTPVSLAFAENPQLHRLCCTWDCKCCVVIGGCPLVRKTEIERIFMK